MNNYFVSAGAFIVGSGHSRLNMPCQDFIFTLNQERVNVIALADGAGSASHSIFGAQAACKVSAKWIAKHFDKFYYKTDSLAKNLDKILLRKFKALAKENNVSIKQLQSTLQIVALKKNRFISIHIGDGVIGCVRDNKLEVISEPNNGEFVNETYFIGGKLTPEQVHVTKGLLSDVDGFVLMSDGSAQSLYNKKEKQISNVVREMLHWFEMHDPSDVQEAILENLRDVISKKTQDDCSLALNYIKRQN